LIKLIKEVLATRGFFFYFRSADRPNFWVRRTCRFGPESGPFSGLFQTPETRAATRFIAHIANDAQAPKKNYCIYGQEMLFLSSLKSI
jgi:hypothetical protein